MSQLEGPQWPPNPDAVKHCSSCLGLLPVVSREAAGCALGYHTPHMLTLARAALLLLILYYASEARQVT